MPLLLHDRIKGNDAVNISSSVFEHLFHKEKGSAISIESSISVVLIIKKSLFRMCFSESTGGSIFLSSQNTSFIVTNCCFDSCSIITHIDGCLGNAINAQSLNSGESQINQTMFYFCGPEMSIASDTTLAFTKIETLLTSPNFTECFSYFGALTLYIDQQKTKLLYMQADRGTSLHITLVRSSEKFEIEKSNIINWTQEGGSNAANCIFHCNEKSKKSEFKDCMIFIKYSFGNVGPCVFNNCFGNINHDDLKTTSFTEYEIDQISFEIYCRGFIEVQGNSPCTKQHLNQFLIPMFLFPCSHMSKL